MGKTGKYQVGLYEDIKGVSCLDAHHIVQKAVMQKLVNNYDPLKAPAINVPKVGHTISILSCLSIKGEVEVLDLKRFGLTKDIL